MPYHTLLGNSRPKLSLGGCTKNTTHSQGCLLAWQTEGGGTGCYLTREVLLAFLLSFDSKKGDRHDQTDATKKTVSE